MPHALSSSKCREGSGIIVIFARWWSFFCCSRPCVVSSYLSLSSSSSHSRSASPHTLQVSSTDYCSPRKTHVNALLEPHPTWSIPYPPAKHTQKCPTQTPPRLLPLPRPWLRPTVRPPLNLNLPLLPVRLNLLPAARRSTSVSSTRPLPRLCCLKFST